MIDSTKDLMRQNKVAAEENTDIFKATPDEPVRKGYDPNFALDLTPENRVATGYAGDYSKYISTIGVAPSGTDLGRMRAQNQSGWEQAFNVGKRAVPNVILGTIGNLASMLDVEDIHNVDNEVGNPITNWTTSLQDEIRELAPIYREDPNASFDFSDSGYIWDNLSMLIDSAGAFAATGLITGGLLGAAAKAFQSEAFIAKLGAKYGAKAAKLIETGALEASKVDAYVANARNMRLSLYPRIMNTLALNQAEGIMEGAGVYKEVFQQKLDENYSVEEAKKIAADAATLDVDLNRANIALNYTSAGLFTSGANAIKQASGGMFKTVLSESAQEAGEEGVNYIAQMEAMQQAKDGDNYQWDTKRAISNLGTVKGAEAMFLGAIGGAANTALTEGVMHNKNVRQTLSDAKQRLVDLKDKVIPNQSAPKQTDHSVELEAEMAKYNLIFDESKQDPTDQAYGRALISLNADAEGATDKKPNTKILDRDIEVYNTILQNPASTEEQKKRAEIAINATTHIKEIAADPSNAIIWGTKNAHEVVATKIVLDDLESNIKSLSEEKAVIESNTQLDEASKKLATKEIDEALSTMTSEYNKQFTNYNKALKNRATVAPEVKADKTEENTGKVTKEAVVQAKGKSNAAKIMSEAPTGPVQGNPAKQIRKGNTLDVEEWNGSSNTIADVIPVMHRHTQRPDGIKFSEESAPVEMGYDEANNVVGLDLTSEQGKSSALVSDSNGNAYVVEDNKTRLDVTTKTDASSEFGQTSTTKEVETTTTIKKLTALVREGEEIKSKHLSGEAAVREFIRSEAVKKDLTRKLSVGNSRFDNSTLRDFIQSKTTTSINFDKSAEVKTAVAALKDADIVSFLRDNLKQTDGATNNNGFTGAILQDDIVEPSIEIGDSELISSLVSEDERTSNPTKRTIVSAVGFLSVPYVKNSITGRLEDSGDAIKEYIENSVPNSLIVGDKLILEAYDGDKILTVDYDANGDAMWINTAAGKIKSKSYHNTESLLAEGRTDIPIAIYSLEKTNGGKAVKTLRGFINNNAYLNEKINGEYIHFTGIDPEVIQREIENIAKIRTELVELYKKNPKKASLESSVTSVGSGRLQYGIEENNISEIMPSDATFGYVYGGIAKDANGNTIEVGNRLDRMKSGTPLMFVKMANGSTFAVPSFSKVLSELNTSAGSYAELAVNGIVSHIKKTNAEVSSFELLKAYLEQFILAQSKTHIEESGNKDTFFHINPDYIEWKNGKNGEKISLSELRGLKGDDRLIRTRLANLQQFLGTQRVNYSKTLLASTLPVNGITKDGRTIELASNPVEHFKKTLKTRIKPLAKASNGENVFAVSPVIGFDSAFINAGEVAETAKALVDEKPEVKTEPKVKAARKPRVTIPKTRVITAVEDDDLIKINMPSAEDFSVTNDDDLHFPATEEASYLSDNVVASFKSRELNNPDVISTSSDEILTSDEKMAGIQFIVLTVDSALEKSGSVNVSKVFKSALNSATQKSLQYEDSASKLDQDSESGYQKALTYVSWIESFNRIRDPKAWNGICNSAIDYLKACGIDIKGETIENLVEEDDVPNDSSIDGFEAEDNGNGWNITDSFYRDPKGYSTIRTKSMVASLLDTKGNVVGLAPLFDHGEAYRRIMTLVSSLPKRGYKDILEALKQESDKISGIIPNNIYKQLLEKLNRATLQEKIQFKIAMNMQRNVFLMTLFDPKNPDGVKVINAQVRESQKLILNEWQSRLKHKLGSSENIKVYIDAALSDFAKVKLEVASIKDVNTKSLTLIRGAKRLFNSIGITLEPETWQELRMGSGKTVYNAKNGFTLGRNTFVSQLDSDGLFDVITSAMTKVKDGAVVADIAQSLNQGFLKFLANIESKYNRRFFPDSFRGMDNNKRYNYSLMTPFADSIIKLKSDPNYIKDQLNTTFSRHSFLLGGQYFGDQSNNFTTSFETMQNYASKDVRRKRQKENKQMSNADSLFSRLKLFQNATKNGTKDNSIIVLTTNSDKSQNIAILSKRSVLNALYFDSNGVLTPAGRNSLINAKNGLLEQCMSTVRGEAERIISFSTATGSKLKKLKDEYGEHAIDNGQFFYGFSFLNNLLTFNYTSKGSVKVSKESLELLDLSAAENDRLFKEAILDYFEKEAGRDIAIWHDLGLIAYDQFGQYSITPVNAGYAKDKGLYGKVSKKIMDKGRERIIHVDGITNYNKALRILSMEANMNASAMQSALSMITYGDVAMSGKNIKNAINAANPQEDLRGAIQKGINVILKEHLGRLAADIAPAQDVEEEYEFTSTDGRVIRGGKTYRSSFVADYMKNTAEYAASVAKAIRSSIPKKITATDGLEYVTVYNKLDSLFRSGKINENDFVRIRDKYAAGRELTPEDLQYFSLGAGKPRQVDQSSFMAGAEQFGKRVYVKSSEIVLIKQITKGFGEEIDSLREAMEKGFNADPSKDKSVGRVSHESTVKTGAGIVTQIYSADGKFLDSKDIRESLLSNIKDMNWSGFGYQLELPEKSGESFVTNVSQADASILEGGDNLSFNYQGEDYSGVEMRMFKHAINRHLSAIAEKEADNALGITEDGQISLALLFEHMNENKNASSISENDMASVYNAIKNNIPLLFSNIPRQVESHTFAMWKDAIKLRRPGGMYPQYPSMGKSYFKDGTVANISSINGLIKTRSFDASRELAMTTVEHNEDGKAVRTTIAECILPYEVYGDDGLIDITTLLDADNFIDSSKLPDSLLKIIGMRTPNEGHSTQMVLKVVAFLPKIHGKAIYVPSEITLQMGSDYDIDKLTTYWKNKVRLYDGSLIGTPTDVLNKNKLNGDVSINEAKLKTWLNKNFAFSNVLDENVNKVRSIIQNKVSNGDILAEDDLLQFLTEEDSVKAKKQLFKLKEAGNSDILNAIDSVGRKLFNPPSVKKLVKQIYEDAYFDIFDSVLSNPVIAEKALTPLDSPDLRTLTQIGQTEEEVLPWFSLRRQSEEYVSSQMTKKGVNLFAKNNSAIIPTENADMYFQTLNDDQTLSRKLFVKFGGLSLSKIDSSAKSKFNGQPRTGKKNIAIQLSESLDERKNKALSGNSLNNNNFNISSTISVIGSDDNTGVDLSYNTLFVKQPSIKMVVNLMDLGNGILADRDSSQNKYMGNAIETVKTKYLDMFSEDAKARILKKVESLRESTYMKEDLIGLLNDAETDGASEDFVARQIDMLNTLADLKDMSDSQFQLIMQTGADSQGFRSTYLDNKAVIANASKIGDSQKVANSAKYLSNNASAKLVDGVMTIGEDSDRLTTTGNNLRMLAEKTNLVGKAMGYENEFISSAIAKISEYTKSKKTEDTFEYVKAIKAFVYAKLPMFRRYSIKQLTDGSLVNEMMELKSLPELNNNMFIRSLEASKSMKYVSIASTPGESIASKRIRDGFRDLIMSKDPRFTSFAEKMIAYEFLAGGSQHASNSIKYIPNSLLDSMGFYSQMRDVINNISSNSMSNEALLKLYLQNNPSAIRFSSTALANINKDGSIDIPVGVVARDAEKNPLRYIKVKGDKYMQLISAKSNESVLRYEPLPLKGGLANENDINTLINDYSSDGEVIAPKSMIVEDLTPSVIEAESHNEFVEKLTAVLSKESNVTELKVLLESIETPYSNWMLSIMDVMNNSLSQVRVRPMTSAEIFEYSKRGVAGIGVYKPTEGKYGALAINMKAINDTFKSIRSSRFIKEVILHEIAHAIQVNAYRAGRDGNAKYAKIYNDVNTIFVDAINNIKELPVVSTINGKPLVGINGTKLTYGMFTSANGLAYTNSKGVWTNVRDIAEQVFPDIYGRDNSELRNDLKFSLYMFTNQEEFMAEISSKNYAQDLMGSVSLSKDAASKIGSKNNKSILRAFLDQMAQFFTKLSSVFVTDNKGVKLSQNSVLEAIFVQNALLAKMNYGPSDNAETATADEPSHPSVDSHPLPGTVREYLQNADKATRIGFRHALNSGIIKTKC